MKIFIPILLLFLFCCKSNKEQKVSTQEVDCSIYNDKYVEYAMINEKDSALYYINKAIMCDPKDDFFKTEKIKLLIKHRDYSNAIPFAKELAIKNDPNYKMLYGVLLLKENNSNADDILDDARVIMVDVAKDYNENNSNLHFYKIALDNYFEGENYSLDMVKKFRENYVTEYDIELANNIENLIKNNSKRDVLLNLFNIN